MKPNTDLLVKNLLADLLADDKLQDLRLLNRNRERAEWVLRHQGLFDKTLGGLLTEGLNVRGSSKSTKKARQLRLDGNKLFSAKRFLESVSKYNEAILLAPLIIQSELSFAENANQDCESSVDQQTLDDDENPLALVLANRSAALFHLKNYREALCDIEEAINYGYPVNITYKLLERRARCCHELGLHLESLAAIEEAILEYEKTRTIRDMVDEKSQDDSGGVEMKKVFGGTKCLERTDSESNLPSNNDSIENKNGGSGLIWNGNDRGVRKSSHGTDAVTEAEAKRNLNKNCKKSENSCSADLLHDDVYQSLIKLRSRLKGGSTKADVKRVNKSSSDDDDEFFTYSVSSSLFDAVELQYSEHAGRYSVSRRDIEPGRAISVEYPTAGVLSSKYSKTHCHHCMRLANLVYPCLRCSDVIFCSPACAQIAWKDYHGYECGTLNCRDTESISIQSSLAFRMLLIGGLQSVMDIFSRDEDVEEKKRQLKCMGTTYPDMVRTMTGHEKAERSDSVQLAMLVEAYYLMRLGEVVFAKSTALTGKPSSASLVSCSTTVADRSDTHEAIEKLSVKNGSNELEFDRAAILAALIRHLQLIQCNAFIVYDTTAVQSDLTASKPVESLPDVLSRWRLREIGVAIYPITALVNHSCDPSVDLLFDGSRCTMRTIKKIKEGEEILIDYGQTFLTHSKSSRQVYLSEGYFFPCQCVACVNDWPQSSELPDQNPTLLCAECHKGTLSGDGVCVRCCKEHGKADLLQVVQRLSQSHDEFRAAVSSVSEGHLTKALSVLCRHLANMQESLALPWRDFYSCQAILRQCFRILSCNGNTRIK